VCFPLQVFICFYVNFISTWFVCCIFFLCFEFGFLLVICESYFGLIMICQLSCYYVILCVVWITIGVNINMVVMTTVININNPTKTFQNHFL